MPKPKRKINKKAKRAKGKAKAQAAKDYRSYWIEDSKSESERCDFAGQRQDQLLNWFHASDDPGKVINPEDPNSN